VSQPVDATSLGDALAPSSLKDEGLGVLQRFLGGLPTNDRLVWLATNLLTPPLIHSEAEARAGAPIELFNILQGDVIRTGAAYQMGSRNEIGTYIVATSTCDLYRGAVRLHYCCPSKPSGATSSRVRRGLRSSSTP